MIYGTFSVCLPQTHSNFSFAESAFLEPRPDPSMGHCGVRKRIAEGPLRKVKNTAVRRWKWVVGFVEGLILGEEGLACETEFSITTPWEMRDEHVRNV
jgi:hypothetical protein